MSNKAIAALEFDASTSEKAQQHTFEFSLDAPGMVRVTNIDYDDPEDHSYLVNVEGEAPVACECPAFEYQPGACKHMVAVAIRTPVLAAVIVRDLEEDAQEAMADGGQLLAEDADTDAEDDACQFGNDRCDGPDGSITAIEYEGYKSHIRKFRQELDYIHAQRHDD